MNISFWSPINEMSFTDKVVAVVYTIMYLYGVESIVFQSDYYNNNLEMSFMDFENEGQIKEDFIYYIDLGIDAVLNSIGENKEDIYIKDFAVEVVKNKSFYLPMSRKNDISGYNEKLKKYIREILKKCNDEFEMCFIDNKNGYGDISAIINEMADVKIIGIESYEECVYNDDNTFYMIPFEKKEFCEKNHLPLERVYTIHNCKNYKEAYNYGRAKAFIRSNYFMPENKDDEEFVVELKLLAEAILNKCGKELRR